MQKCRLSKKPMHDIIRELSSSFSALPVVPRDCVRALNLLVYNLQDGPAPPEVYKQVVFLVLRGLTSNDEYLRNYIYTTMIELGRQTKDGILAINCIVKDLDNRKTSDIMKDTALRALFSNLPASMFYDFEKYVKAGLLAGNDAATVVASEYFRESKVPLKAHGTIQDLHQAFFNRLPVNRYSSMVEVERLAAESPDNLSSFLFISVDVVIFLEAVKSLLRLKPERIALFVDKAVNVLAALLRRQDAEAFAAVKLLSELSLVFPQKVAGANEHIENLIHSPCRCISMIAILTLLKTGTDTTVTNLAEKLEPLMQSMSCSYKRMAIDTMEKLAGSKTAGQTGDPYFAFLKKALFDKGDLEFKKYITGKIEKYTRECGDRSNVIRALCAYLEDPEYYQVSMDALGILGGCLEEPRDLLHIYNRLILDNCHVRKAAIQTLFDLEPAVEIHLHQPADGGARRTCFTEAIARFKDEETAKLCGFLESCPSGMKRGAFSQAELGDLHDEVLKYVELEQEEVQETEPDAIKECRRIALSPASSDVSVHVVKKIFKESVVLEFQLKNNMDRVRLGSGLLSLEIGASKHRVEIEHTDFVNGEASKELSITAEEGDEVYGVFEYQVYLEGDDDDVDNDTIELSPFSFTIFDFIRPVQAGAAPSNSRPIDIMLKGKPAEAASKIIEMTNLCLVADKNNFSLSGTYRGSSVLINASMQYTRATNVHMEIFCDDSALLDKMVTVFE
ncbi:coatomer subunit gamma [Pancytospora philotis]|nr:coatomer subunit gamma [Pancytospora philotis]